MTPVEFRTFCKAIDRLLENGDVTGARMVLDEAMQSQKKDTPLKEKENKDK